jgi:hypothetical protein
VRQLTFAAGVNNADSIITPKIREGLFEVVEPKGARGFLLRPRVTYKLEVWDDGYFFPAFFSTTRYLRFTKPEVSAPEQPK